MSRLWFLGTRTGNRFMNELLDAIAAAASRAGAQVDHSLDGYPGYEPGDAYVLIPHEFFACVPSAWQASSAHLAATVGIGVEQPGTQWFAHTADHGQRLGALLDINRVGARELGRRGVRAGHLQLGYVPEWDGWGGVADRPRSVDVLYLGSDDPRRSRLLAGYADCLSTRRQRLLIAPLAPKPQERPDFLTGARKHRLLADSAVILNLHRDGALGVLEWVRVLEAMCNGCAVVSEHSLGSEPLVAGEHFLSGRPEDVALLADGLLEDPSHREEVANSAYRFLRDELTIDAGIGSLLDAVEAVSTQGQRAPQHDARVEPDAGSELHLPPPLSPSQVQLVALVDARLHPLRAALKQLTLDGVAQRRELAAYRAGLNSLEAAERVEVLAQTPSYQATTPEVSVLISLYNYEREVIDALASVAVSDHRSFEVVILDDGSSDGSVEAVHQFLWDHEWLAIRLLSHRVNRGVGRTRNALIDAARGQLVFMLDADNTVFPSALSRLHRALDAEPGAALAYGISAVEESGRAADLLSVGVWEPARLRLDNYIDGMAMIRHSVFGEIGGYAEDLRLTGWEDYDLWVRVAQAGMAGIYVPEIVARYRRKRHSMLAAITNVDTTVARSVLEARTPEFFTAVDSTLGAIA